MAMRWSVYGEELRPAAVLKQLPNGLHGSRRENNRQGRRKEEGPHSSLNRKANENRYLHKQSAMPVGAHERNVLRAAAHYGKVLSIFAVITIYARPSSSPAPSSAGPGYGDSAGRHQRGPGGYGQRLFR